MSILDVLFIAWKVDIYWYVSFWNHNRVLDTISGAYYLQLLGKSKENYWKR